MVDVRVHLGSRLPQCQLCQHVYDVKSAELQSLNDGHVRRRAVSLESGSRNMVFMIQREKREDKKSNFRVNPSMLNLEHGNESDAVYLSAL